MRKRLTANVQLDRIYDEYGPAVFAFLLDMTRNPADTYKAFHELFTALAVHPDLVKGIAKERLFLLREARNQAIDIVLRKAAQPRQRPPAIEELLHLFVPSLHPEEREFRIAVTEALASLTLDQRAVIHLGVWEHLSPFDIAAVMRITPDEAAHFLRMAIDRLQDRLGVEIPNLVARLRMQPMMAMPAQWRQETLQAAHDAAVRPIDDVRFKATSRSSAKTSWWRRLWPFS